MKKRIALPQLSNQSEKGVSVKGVKKPFSDPKRFWLLCNHHTH